MSDAPRWRAFLNWCPRRQLGRLFWRAGVPGFDDIADAPAELDAERVTESLDAFTNSAFADRTGPSAVLRCSYRPERVERLLERTTGDLLRTQVREGAEVAGCDRHPRGSARV